MRVFTAVALVACIGALVLPGIFPVVAQQPGGEPAAVDEQTFVTGMGGRPSPHVANPGGLPGYGNAAAR